MFTPYFLATSSDSRTLCPEDTRERSSLLWPRGARMREEGADDSGSKKLSSSTIELTLRPCQVAFATVFCCRRDVPLLPTFALHRRWGSFPLCWSLRAPHKKAKQLKTKTFVVHGVFALCLRPCRRDMAAIACAGKRFALP